MNADDSLPDPVAYARGLSDDQLMQYEEIYGEKSREWIIAQRELSRRRYPLWAKVFWNIVAVAVAIGIAIKVFS